MDTMINSNVHFITYGDDKFAKAKNRITNEAKSFGEFSTITAYSPENLSMDFKVQFSDILTQKRGGGYWIWKIDIIRQSLLKINTNDFLVYMDAGCTVNLHGKNKYAEYMQLFEHTDHGILSFQMDMYPERNWTTKKIFDYFDVDLESNIATTGQYCAGIIIFKKNNHSKLFIDEFTKCINFDSQLITDKYNDKIANRFLKENRHDQSIMSLIRKKIGSIVIPDETQLKPFGSNKSKIIPFWQTRYRSH